MLLAADYPFLDVFWSILIFFVWVMWFMLLFHVIADVFRRRAPGFPLCGIAGIDASNAGEAVGAGADGVAVISALSLQADPQAAARALRAVVDAALAQRQRR